MKIKRQFFEGYLDGPLFVFVHGMGMDMSIWSNPSAVKILGGLYPLRAVLHEPRQELNTLFSDFRALGFTVLTWSQSRPLGPLEIAVEELAFLIKEYTACAARNVILIGHSRGGLIARRYCEIIGGAPKGLITIASPHHGTTLAKWSVHFSPLASLVEKLLGSEGGELRPAIKRILGFIGSAGIRELLPDSPLYSKLTNNGKKGVPRVSVGGTNPDLIKIGNVSVLELLSKIVPESAIPDEMKAGLGDGLVSAASSLLPYGDRHFNVHCNHVSLLFDREVRDFVIAEVMKGMTIR
jgi:pimeloyl-ACP methyl ester carboxylesterase